MVPWKSDDTSQQEMDSNIGRPWHFSATVKKKCVFIVKTDSGYRTPKSLVTHGNTNHTTQGPLISVAATHNALIYNTLPLLESL